MEEEVYYDAAKDQATEGKQKYAISCWDIAGGTPYQVLEYPFSGTPSRNEFRVSSCGKFIFFVLKVKEDETSYYSYMRVVVILNIDTLTEYKRFIIPEEIKGINIIIVI